MDRQLRVMVIGAHPDDPDLTTGGTAAKYARLGHRVRYVSATNGGAGHQTMGGAELVRVRTAEAQAVARVAGIEYVVMDNDDAYLETDVKTREKIVREIRLFSPDLIFTHRPNDYHPDHRNTSTLVQDASYLVMVPNFCKSTPALRHQPIILYVYDRFQKPAPFSPDIVVDVSDALEQKLRMVHCHTSQMYDWLRWIDGTLDQVPDGEEQRFEWLKAKYLPYYQGIAERYREQLIHRYGETQGRAAVACEAFERCEYGGNLAQEDIPRYFPF